MSFFDRVKTTRAAPFTESHADAQRTPDNKNDVEASTGSFSGSDADPIDKDAQAGVQKMEATTQVWTKQHLVAAYIIIWLLYFIDTMQQGMTGALTPYVTSAYQQHSLTATASIMSSLIGGLSKLPLAKIIDIWGRPQGYALMLAIVTLGLIMMAGCNNVETYAAAQVFHWIGYNGLNYTLSIFIADTSSLKNRSFMFAFSNSPYIITTWIGGPLAAAFYNKFGFRWGFGAFAIITPIVHAPLIALFTWNYHKAKRTGLITRKSSDRTVLQSVRHYFLEFDLVGLLLICGGLALLLLPFSLSTYQANGWKSPMIICMIVFGVALTIGFALYEKFIAPKTFIPFHLLTDRTIVGANVLAAVLFVSFYIWNSYFSSFPQVVNGLTITEASYVANIYSIGSCFWALIIGLAIRYTGRFKWLALYFGVPLAILGVALMVRFRQPDINIGYVVMCQIFIAFAGGTLVICEQIAVMAVVSHQYVTVVLALEGMFSSVGGAIGSTVAAAIWTGTFPERLQFHLPADAKADYTEIYASLPTQLSYEKGTPIRQAIEAAYGDSQRYMLIGASAVLVLAIASVAVWRDVKVKDFKQTKGLVV